MIVALALAALRSRSSASPTPPSGVAPDLFHALCKRYAPARFGDDPRGLALGAAPIGAGQCLNFAVFHRSGAVGVFYGSRFGRAVPWVCGFPFSVLAHPQYVGAVAAIWGLFLATRFPHPDWIAFSLLETIYYAVGARLGRGPGTSIPARRVRGGRRDGMMAQQESGLGPELLR